MAFIQHFTLRLFLWRAGSIPRKYIHFLDYAAEHILLRKVGGGYSFVHRLLQDYFAFLDSLLRNHQEISVEDLNEGSSTPKDRSEHLELENP
jgi:hypothetical protein